MRKSDFDFANDIKKASEQSGSRTAWMLLILVILTTGAFLIWASIATVEQGATGIGRVIPSSQTQLVENLEAGIVRVILVREGALVKEGQVLVKMENTGASSRLSELLQRELELSAELARLELESEFKQDFDIPNPDNRFSDKILQDQKAIFLANLNRLEGNIQIRRFQRIQKVQALTEARANINKQQQAIELADRELKLTSDLFRKKAIPELEFIKAKRATQELTGNLEITSASIERIEAEIDETDAQIKAEKSNYLISALERYSLVNSDLTAVVERIKEARQKVRQSDLKSPVTGIVNQLNVAAIGEVLLPGSTVVEITPIDDQLLIEAEIRPQDIAFIRPGLEARIRLSAYDYTKYGSFTGTVERIGADTVVNEDNQSFFRIVISTSDANSFPEEVKIIPGMVATVNVLTGERTILDLILKPILRVKDEAFRN
ncbi:MAG: HlyD family type I secretion periplasmic adaptor subunit [Salaquimonas sp.]